MVKFQIVPLEQQTPEWMAFKKGKIGSSAASAIMGESFFETPLQCWERHIFHIKKETSSAMSRGIELEPKARAWVNEKLKVNFEPAVIQSIEHPEMIASLDGFEMKGSAAFLLEIKCPGNKDHMEAVGGNIPGHYRAQLQHQMMVADVEEMLYCSFDGTEGVILECKRDHEYCKKLFCAEIAFIQRLADFDPPPYQDGDWLELIDSEQVRKANRLKQIDEIMKELLFEKNELESEIKSTLTHPRCKIGDIKIQKISRPGAIDYPQIEVLKTMDLEKYRKPLITYWRFSFG
jgi:putative phage-type endonuclease